MTILREKGYGADGTCRANSGIVQDLVDKKDREKKRDIYEWGDLFKAISNDNQVCQLAWKDSGLVIFQSTAHTEDEPPKQCLRRRPGKIFLKAKSPRVPFVLTPGQHFRF